MTDNINEYDELIMKYEELFHSTHHPSSTEYKQKLAELEQLADPNVLLKKTIIDKLVELPCYKLQEYLSFFGGQAQTGDILKLPEPSTRKCIYGDKCYRQGNLQHMAEFTHPSTVPRHHIHLLFEKLHEIIKSKSDDKCGASKRRKRKNTKKRKNFRKTKKNKRNNTRKKIVRHKRRLRKTHRGGAGAAAGAPAAAPDGLYRTDLAPPPNYRGMRQGAAKESTLWQVLLSINEILHIARNTHAGHTVAPHPKSEWLRVGREAAIESQQAQQRNEALRQQREGRA